MYEGPNLSSFERAGWRDQDGLLIPEIWRGRPDRWATQPLSWRTRHSQDFEAKQAKPAPEPKQTRAGWKAFTTKAAKNWGRALGWRVVDEERSFAYQRGGKWQRRTADLMLGSDLMFACPGVVGLTLVQAGGKSERKRHLERFNDRGGILACIERGCRFFYVEFERGNETPILIEQWAPLDIL